MTSAEFFSWLSDADFYAQAHAEAVALVPPGPGTWIDVGCGPGLVTRLAAERGFRATGYDRSLDMVLAARRRTAGLGARVRFEQASLAELERRAPSADVVSAASLLAVLPDPGAALELLWRQVSAGGVLLIIETTPLMRAERTLRALKGRRAVGLLMWGLARRGRSAAPTVDVFHPEDLASAFFHPLLEGLLGAWVLRRAPLLVAGSPSSPTEVPIQENDR